MPSITAVSTHSNIQKLNTLYIKHKVDINVSPNEFLCDREDYRQIILSLGRKSFTFYVEDEYDDFRYNYPILNFCLAIRELEEYEYCDDYLMWCAERYLNASDMQLREYYMGLNKIFNDIKSIIGEVKSYIPDMDFEFGMGEVTTLREGNWQPKV